MVLTPAPPRQCSPAPYPHLDPELHPGEGPLFGHVPKKGARQYLGLGLADPIQNPSPSTGHPLLAGPQPPGTAGAPGTIMTWSRRRRRRRLAAAVFAAVTACLAALPASHPVPGGSARARTLPSTGVIQMARARQQRRRQRFAQSAADTIAAGGGATAGLHSPWRIRTGQARPRRRKLPGPDPKTLTGINVLGWGCRGGARNTATDGRHTWVTCNLGNTFELDAATGAPIRDLDAATYHLSNPDAIASDGRHVWVTDDPAGRGGFMTELDGTTGTPIRELAGPGYRFNRPVAVAEDRAHLWVANDPVRSGGAVAELDAATGKPIRTLTRPDYLATEPAGLAADGTRIWTTGTELCHAAVTELDTATGKPIRILKGPSYPLVQPTAITTDGSHIWVTNIGSDSVTEFPAAFR